MASLFANYQSGKAAVANSKNEGPSIASDVPIPGGPPIPATAPSALPVALQLKQERNTPPPAPPRLYPLCSVTGYKS